MFHENNNVDTYWYIYVLLIDIIYSDLKRDTIVMPYMTNPFKIISNHLKTGSKTSIQPIELLLSAFPAFESKQTKKNGKYRSLFRTNDDKLRHKVTTQSSNSISFSTIVFANDYLLSIIISHSSIFDLFEWRCICQQFRRIIDDRLTSIIHLSITKENWINAMIDDEECRGNKSKSIFIFEL